MRHYTKEQLRGEAEGIIRTFLDKIYLGLITDSNIRQAKIHAVYHVKALISEYDILIMHKPKRRYMVRQNFYKDLKSAIEQY